MTAPAPQPWRVLHLPKRGHRPDEYEDAWAADAGAGRFAVADGASESSYAGLWARLLVQAFVAERRPWDGPDWLAGPRRRWSAEVDRLALSWYAEMKREQGAHATLLGLALRPPAAGAEGRWRALAVGDSCLVRVRDGERPRSFPLRRSTEFDNAPRLLGSRPGAAPVFDVSRGSCRVGDRLFLMTDALAQWFLLRCEQDGRPWDELAALPAGTGHESAFAAWIEERRDQGGLRNDDVTLLTVGPISAASEE
jgi:hypothetical protein